MNFLRTHMQTSGVITTYAVEATATVVILVAERPVQKEKDASKANQKAEPTMFILYVRGCVQ